jgi:hypothetical protein
MLSCLVSGKEALIKRWTAQELRMISEILGEARQEQPVSEEEMESLTIARVELERRRVDRNGIVKQKLSCAGVTVNKCTVSFSSSLILLTIFC